MQVYFWGTRGSLPASVTAKMVERKIFKALQASRSCKLESDDAIKAFIRRELPFAVRGSYGGNTSCVEIRGQEDYILCDAGTGLRDFGDHFIKTANTGQTELPAVFHIFISHLHWDHIQGFPLFTPLYLPGHRIHIYGHHPDLEQTFFNQQDAHSFPVPLEATKADISFHVMEPGKAYDIAGINVSGIKQNHPGDSYGYCFIKGKKRSFTQPTQSTRKMQKQRITRSSSFSNMRICLSSTRSIPYWTPSIQRKTGDIQATSWGSSLRCAPASGVCVFFIASTPTMMSLLIGS